MQIHEVLKSYLDLTEATLASAEEIEAYNILRIFAHQITPKFDIGDTVRPTSYNMHKGYKIFNLHYSLSLNKIFYASKDMKHEYSSDFLELVSKNEDPGVDPVFGIGDHIAFYERDEYESGTVFLNKVDGTIYQIIGNVYYIRKTNGEITTRGPLELELVL